MDKGDLMARLGAHMKSWRRYSYLELAHLVDTSFSFSVRDDAGLEYSGSVVVYWDDEPDGAIRVMGSLHHRAGEAIPPLVEAFTVAPASPRL